MKTITILSVLIFTVSILSAVNGQDLESQQPIGSSCSKHSQCVTDYCLFATPFVETGECACEPVVCELACVNGYAKDADGCEICECNPCEPVACDLYCKYGFAKGDDGCEVCECNSCQTDADCPQIQCIKAPCPQYSCVNGECVMDTVLEPQCEAFFSHCSCSWICVPVSDEPRPDCAMACQTIVNPELSKPECVLVNGECVEKTSSCTDSDNGKVYYVKGTVTYGSESKTDSCAYCTGACLPDDLDCVVTCGAVVEYYCDGNEIASETIVCDNSCNDGACTDKCAKEGEYSSPTSAYAIDCCEGLEGFDTYASRQIIPPPGSGALCYDPDKGTPECQNIGTKSEGWYYSRTGDLLRYESCSGSTSCNRDDPCAADEFCELVNCEAESGQCTQIQDLCTADDDQICGCDGETYTNDCARQMAKVTKKHDGACVSTSEVMSYIDRWKQGVVSITELFRRILHWRS